VIDNLLLGFSIVLQWQNLAYAFVGAFVGTLIGVLPGIGPLAAIAMLLPVTFTLEPTSGLIMLAGIYYGAQYGGSTTAILINMPGENSSVVTCLDGYRLARKGQAGPALAVAALASFFAGSIATCVIAFGAPMLAESALSFGAPEYFALMVLGLIAAVSLSSSSFIKAVAMVILGLFLGLVGTDLNSGTLRFTFGIGELYEGIEFVSLAIGLFALGEIIANLESKQDRSIISGKITNLMPTLADLRAAVGPAFRGTIIGSTLGLLPGGGALISSFAAYAVEKRVSGRTGEPFGTGRIEGVAAPEAANNAGAQTSFIPMLTLGLPSNALMALMLGGLLVHGITPGPDLIRTKPDLFWGVVTSMWIGNLMLVVLNLPLVGIWVRLLRVPYGILFPAIVLLACIGVYCTNLKSLDVIFAAGFGVVGYLLRKLDCDITAVALSFVLGPLMEQYFRRSLLLSRGDPAIFLNRPYSAGLLALAVVLILFQAFSFVRDARQKYFAEDEV
jgi:TctA family transporter